MGCWAGEPSRGASPITVRVPAELRVFVAVARRAETMDVATDGVSSLGHVVESLGIPLTEVGRLTVDGAEVPAAHVPTAGEDGDGCTR